MASARSEYERLKPAWHRANPFCQFPGCKARADASPHHIRGRLGSLLCDTRFWLPICLKHHCWIHVNIAEARKLGLYAQVGELNTPVK